jgi:lipopolysaccharide export system protein LptA
LPNSVGQVARRRKLITRTVTWALGVTLVLVGAGYWWSRRHDNKPVQVPQTLPTNVNQRLSGYTFTRSDEGRQIFSVHAARTVAFKQGGTTVLEDVFVEVFGRTGARRDILRTRRCDYNTQSGDLFSSGKVEIELNAGPEGKAMGARRERRQVLLETSRVYFRGRGSLVVSDEPVRYRIGAVAGSARGMTYATKDGWLELSKDVTAEFTPPESAQPQLPLRLTASRARYDKERGEVVLWPPVEFSQGNRRVEAGRGVLILNARNRIVQAVLEEGTRAADLSEKERLEGSALRIRGDFDPETEQLRTVWAEGDVQVESRREGSISRLEAQQLEVAFAGAHPQPQSGSASGNVKLMIESSRAPGNGSPTQAAPERLRVEKKELTSSALRFAFQSAGKSLKQAETVGSGKLVLIPPDPRVGERVVTAGQFLMDFDARNRLETLRGISGTRIVFQPGSGAPAGSLAQESSAERLEASFDPATQAVRAVRQAGGFQFREGDRQAAAEQASYQAEAETLTLTGRPQLWDLETRTRAERFVLDLRSDTAEGVGKVQSTHLGPAGRGEGGRQSDPTHVLADRVVAERRSQVVHYEGNVRAWHGSDVVESSALDVSRTERRVSSGLQVRSSHLQPAALMPAAASASGSKAEARPVVICADRLEYLDAGRRASYRGNVRLQAEMTTLEADGLDVYFSSAASVEQAELERAVAEGHVHVVQPSRRATGNHAEYFAREGKILLSGGPPTLYDAEKGFITGQRLTFHIHDDRLQADGGDESPTVSKHRIAQ